jgi:hypothetical protein
MLILKNVLLPICYLVSIASLWFYHPQRRLIYLDRSETVWALYLFALHCIRILYGTEQLGGVHPEICIFVVQAMP